MIGGVQDTNLLISVFVVICRVILWIYGFPVWNLLI